MYCSVIIPWEPNPKLRTEWHPTTPIGPMSTLSRGAFPTQEQAQTWVDKNLPLGTKYSFKTFPSPEEA